MALIECYECARQMSSDAPACPGCGAPNRGKQGAVREGGQAMPLPVQERKVSIWLILGNLFLPYFFYWFLLGKGYSSTARVIGGVWLAVFVFSYIGNMNNPSADGNASSQPSVSGSTVSGEEERSSGESSVLYKLANGEKSKPNDNYGVSNADYREVSSEVGCDSSYSDQKKDDVFEAKYKNKWMTWRGEIVLLESDQLSLNVDGVGIQDLSVELSDEKAGYDLVKGSTVTVKFLMKSAGGCFLPFGGESAEVL